MSDQNEFPIQDLSNAMRRDFKTAKDNGTLGKTVLLIGAGCSASAKIPLAKEISQNLVCELASAYGFSSQNNIDPEKSLDFLVKENHFSSNIAYSEGSSGNILIDWSSIYDELFSNHYNSPKEVHRIFSDIFEKNGRAINWTHICIGELVRSGYISTILTTNFDQLALEGIARTGRLPIVADGLEYLGRITGDPIHPQLVQIHGSRHTYHLRNSIADVEELSKAQPARHAIDELFRTATVFVVVGYAGRENGIMNLLVESGKRYPHTRIFWCTYSEKINELPELVRNFLSTSSLSNVIHGYDSDEFFDELLSELGIHTPKIIDDPLYTLQELTENLVYGPDSSIAHKIGSLKIKTNDLRSAEAHLSALSQDQKMQVVGQLASGIAHDFNNLITAILLSTDHFLLTKSVDSPDLSDLIEVKRNANRAAVLVRQLLAFSRKQTLTPKPIMVPDVISDLRVLIDRLVGHGIKTHLDFEELTWPIEADLGQFEQVMINLAVNARDAMPEGGDIIFRVRNISETDIKKMHLTAVEPVDSVLINVIDEGTGISPDDIERIFEPFYTTKAAGKGTGLGLSMVYGIIRQSGGHIFAESKVGHGTTIHILMPRYMGEMKPASALPPETIATERQAAARGTELVLLVEDEDAVREGMARMLESRGYKVHQTGSGTEAMESLKSIELAGGKVDLVISNVVMPQMDGPSLYREIRKEHPALKVLFISGYASEAFATHLPPDSDYGFLPKPFSLKQLSVAVRETLDT